MFTSQSQCDDAASPDSPAAPASRSGVRWPISVGVFLLLAAGLTLLTREVVTRVLTPALHDIDVTSSQPSLEFAGLTDGVTDGVLDLGEQPRGAIKDFTLTVSNPSATDPVRIERIQTTCWCTTAYGLPVTIPPGESVEVPYSIHTPPHSDTWSVGLYFQSDDGRALGKITAAFRLPGPFPDHAAAAAPGAPLRLPIAALYSGVIKKVECFAHPSDVSVPARIEDSGAVVVVDAPPAGTDRLDFVFTTTAVVLGEPERFGWFVTLADPSPVMIDE